MFGLFSKKENKDGTAINVGLLKTDMHSHLLPGIDDGSPDIKTSIQLIRGMAALGYTKLITTPHIMWDIYQNTTEIILDKLKLVQAAVKENNIPVEVHAAAEYFLDDYVEQLIRNKQPLLTISGNMVLVEFSMAYPSMSLKDILFNMQMQGYQPVIAHPERYIYLEKGKHFYDELKEIGCLFQLNILSLGNYYGRSATELTQYLIKKGYYDLIGTDLHHARHLDGLHNPALSANFQKLLDTGRIINTSL